MYIIPDICCKTRSSSV